MESICLFLPPGGAGAFLHSESASLQSPFPSPPIPMACVLQEQIPREANVQDLSDCYRDNPTIIPITSSKDQTPVFMWDFTAS